MMNAKEASDDHGDAISKLKIESSNLKKETDEITDS